MSQQPKPLTEDAREGAVRYIDEILKLEVGISPLSRMYLENAKTLLRGGQS